MTVYRKIRHNMHVSITPLGLFSKHATHKVKYYRPVWQTCKSQGKVLFSLLAKFKRQVQTMYKR